MDCALMNGQAHVKQGSPVKAKSKVRSCALECLSQYPWTMLAYKGNDGTVDSPEAVGGSK